MSHEYRILSNMLIEGKISSKEFIERIDAIGRDAFASLADKFTKNEIELEEYIERYNRLIKEESEPFGPPGPHEHI